MFADRAQLGGVWDTNEGMLARSFRMVFGPFLGVDFPRDGSPHTTDEDGVRRVTSAKALDGANAGKMRFRPEVEGPASKTTVDCYTYFEPCGGDFEPRSLDDTTGRWQVELIADPDTMAPTSATITMELSRTKEGKPRRARSVTRMSFR